MRRINKLYFVGSVIVLSLSLPSCNQEKKSVSTTMEVMEMSSATTYLSIDKQHEFIVLPDVESDGGKITVRDAKANKTFSMQRVESGSGVKYDSEEGYTLWTKGSEFIWGKDGETITEGYLKTTEVEVEKEVKAAKFISANYGNYVDDEYSNKEEGNDWIAVIIKPIDQFKVKISVRSRGDKKPGTCTLDAIGEISDENTLRVFENGITIVFAFKDGTVSIAADQETDNSKLSYFCSGGANLAGTYSKIEGDLDRKQIDKTGYAKSITYNNISFLVEENAGEVTVTPNGLEVTKAEKHPVHGEIINVEVDDLNNDSFPELLIYTRSGVNANGEVIGYSVTNGKSMSKINILKISDNPEANIGYQGHDEYAMVEGTFIHRFPIYTDGLVSGRTKQIQYKLEDSETMRQLVVDKIMEY